MSDDQRVYNDEEFALILQFEARQHDSSSAYDERRPTCGGAHAPTRRRARSRPGLRSPVARRSPPSSFP